MKQTIKSIVFLVFASLPAITFAGYNDVLSSVEGVRFGSDLCSKISLKYDDGKMTAKCLAEQSEIVIGILNGYSVTYREFIIGVCMDLNRDRERGFMIECLASGLNATNDSKVISEVALCPSEPKWSLQIQQRDNRSKCIFEIL